MSNPAERDRTEMAVPPVVTDIMTGRNMRISEIEHNIYKTPQYMGDPEMYSSQQSHKIEELPF